MNGSTSLDDSIRGHEGFREHPYLDTKRLWTIGYGRCLETNPLSTSEWRYLLSTGALAVSITQEGAGWLMRKELFQVENECRKLSFWPKLNDVRRNVILEMAYQMGVSGVRNFKKAIAAMEATDWNRAADELADSEWARTDSPARARKLIDQFRSGELNG